MSASSDLVNMYKQQRADYDKYSAPIVAELEAQAVSTQYVDRAVAKSATIADDAKAMAARTQGMTASLLLPAQQAALNSAVDRSAALGKGSIVTQAHASQKASHIASRQQLMSVAESLQSTGIAGTSSVASAQAARDAQYKADKQAYKSQLYSTVGMVAGSFAGPGGAAIGAGLGGAAAGT